VYKRSSVQVTFLTHLINLELTFHAWHARFVGIKLVRTYKCLTHGNLDVRNAANYTLSNLI